MRATVAQGRYPLALIFEEMLKIFERGWLEGGSLLVDLVKPIFAGDTITIRGIIKKKTMEHIASRLVLDVWVENHKGEKVMAGEAIGLLHPDDE